MCKEVIVTEVGDSNVCVAVCALCAEGANRMQLCVPMWPMFWYNIWPMTYVAAWLLTHLCVDLLQVGGAAGR